MANCLICGCEGKMEKHHVIPKVLEPKGNMIVQVCTSCHRKLNALYVKNPRETTNAVTENFDEFRDKYEELREKFHAGKLNRGQFGEALWTNLVTYLESCSSKEKKKK